MTEATVAPLTEFITPNERMARVDIRVMAHRCAHALRTAVRRPDDPLTEITGAFNKGALMFALAGDAAEAEHSCRRQIAVLGHALTDPRSRAVAAANILRPWVNIGRLRVRQGRWREALPYFADVRALLDLEAVDVGGVKVSRRHLAELADQPWYADLRYWARYVLVRDITEAHLRGHAYAELADIVAGWRHDPELAAMALATEARAMADAAGHGPRSWSLAGHVGALRRAGVRSGAELALVVHDGFRMPSGPWANGDGYADADRTLAERLPADLEHAGLLLRLGQLLHRRNRPDLAAWYLRRVLDIARAAGDEPLEVDAATALLAGDPADREALQARITALAESTLYFPVRRRAGSAPLRAADVAELRTLRDAELTLVETFAARTRPLPVH
ncbi:hypothetical protein [Krasilnikovia sp. M28-CT-15]|uniref:hypothetical protein n=1 Tax=Krasilnikovia sp. M28-CT-15 TaxID=3373540 RepID=UPI003876ED90